jgi:hypothetical protein
MTADGHFYAEIRQGTERLKREIGYNPTYFNRMVADHGPIEATRRLVMADTVSEGFTKLWEHGRLAMTVEALAILPWYAPLFEPEVVTRARRRLADYGFDVDSYVAERTANPPTWSQGDG